MKYISIKQAAEQLGLSERRTREICLQHDIGVQIDGVRGRLLTAADVQAIERQRGSVGNPQFGAEFGNGRQPKKRRKRPGK